MIIKLLIRWALVVVACTGGSLYAMSPYQYEIMRQQGLDCNIRDDHCQYGQGHISGATVRQDDYTRTVFAYHGRSGA